MKTAWEAERAYRRRHGRSALRDGFIGLCSASRWELHRRIMWIGIDAHRHVYKDGRPPPPRPSLPAWCIRFLQTYGALAERLIPVHPSLYAQLDHPLVRHVLDASQVGSDAVAWPDLGRVQALALGCIPAQIQEFYRREGRGEVHHRLLFEGVVPVLDHDQVPYPRLALTAVAKEMSLLGAALDMQGLGTSRPQTTERWRKRIQRWHRRAAERGGTTRSDFERREIVAFLRRLDDALPTDATLLIEEKHASTEVRA